MKNCRYHYLAGKKSPKVSSNAVERNTQYGRKGKNSFNAPKVPAQHNDFRIYLWA